MADAAVRTAEDLDADILAHEQAIVRGRNDIRLGRLRPAEQAHVMNQMAALYDHLDTLRAQREALR